VFNAFKMLQNPFTMQHSKQIYEKFSRLSHKRRFPIFWQMLKNIQHLEELSAKAGVIHRNLRTTAEVTWQWRRWNNVGDIQCCILHRTQEVKI
jgi:hypothetical protein